MQLRERRFLPVRQLLLLSPQRGGLLANEKALAWCPTSWTGWEKLLINCWRQVGKYDKVAAGAEGGGRISQAVQGSDVRKG